MTRKSIDQSREIRLWIRDIIVPAVVAGAVIFSKPEARYWVKDRVNDIKQKFKKD